MSVSGAAQTWPSAYTSFSSFHHSLTHHSLPSAPWKPTGTTAPKRSRSESRNSETVFDYAGKRKQAVDIENRMSAADFWNNQERARETVGELKSLRGILKPLEEVVKTGDDLP